MEDEPSILRGLTDLFVYHGYDVESETDGQKGMEAATATPYACVILDVMLPSMNGFEICDRLRKQFPTLPILMLTAKNSEQDIINGLTLGADDYVGKPFSTSELVLRVGALVRRGGWAGTDNDIVLSEDVSICAKTLSGKSYGKELRYTRREVEVISYLFRSKTSVSRNALLQDVWGYKTTEFMDTRTVDIHIAKIRKKIEKDPRAPRHLITHRGEGYRLIID